MLDVFFTFAQEFTDEGAVVNKLKQINVTYNPIISVGIITQADVPS